MQNIELRLPVNNNLTIWIFYSFTAGEWSVRSALCLLMYTLLYVGSWSTGGVVSKLRECYWVRVLRGCKNITVCNANANSPEAAKFQNSTFSTLQMPPHAQCRPGRMPHSPPSRRHYIAIIPSSAVWDLGIYMDSDLSVQTHVQRSVAGCFAVCSPTSAAQHSSRCSVVCVSVGRCCPCTVAARLRQRRERIWEKEDCKTIGKWLILIYHGQNCHMFHSAIQV